jgi:16S rRNA C967 or C1407 C5-methylase (RsmB/RsmF family)/NOL1/NOP2/fmu family ribosome biogenesis protein
MFPPDFLPALAGLPGFDEATFVAAHEAEPPVTIRLNPAKPTDAFDAAARVPWSTWGRRLPERPVFTLDPLFHAGCYYVQEASSMAVEAALRAATDPGNDLRVLDLCAAPGGKSTALASLLTPDSVLVANEVIKPRAAVLADNLTKWGLVNSFVTNNDPKDFQRLPGFFDVLLVDAPCSGSGLFRKDPLARTEWSLEAVRLCAQRQQRILADAWPTLREGGVLVYATCSYAAAENEQVLDWLAETFAVESVPVPELTAQGVRETRSERGLLGYRFWPDQVPGEGFFLAVLRKRSAEPVGRFRAGKPVPTKNRRTEAQAFGRWVADLDTYDWIAKNDEYYLLRPAHRAIFEQLAGALYLRKAGVRLGRLAGTDLIPDHELAQSVALRPDAPALDLDRAQALRFLRKEELAVPAGTGWAVVRHDDHALGWAKRLPNRLNNYYPKDLRILMEIREN